MAASSLICVLLFMYILDITTARVPEVNITNPTYRNEDSFSEELLIKPLASGHVFVYFYFPIKWNVTINTSDTFHHFRLFPRSLGEIISKYWVNELHLSVTQGLWRNEKWGYPVRGAPPGAELWIWFHERTPDVSLAWEEISNALSGQFCASLNFIDGTNTVKPLLSFRPAGIADEKYAQNSSYLRYAALPQETVCTENLTPWKKLLPCDTKAGLSTLLNAINLFNNNYISLAVDLQNVCRTKDCTSISVELQLSVSAVFEPPVTQLGKQDWSFVKLFGMALTTACPLASQSNVYVDITGNQSGIPFILTPSPSKVISYADSSFNSENKESRMLAVYNLQEWFSSNRQINIAAAYKKSHIYWIIPPPPIHATRYISGYGQEAGGIRCSIYNNHYTKSLKIVYTEVVPWFLRLYVHTLEIVSSGKKIIPDYQYYQAARDRERSHLLELAITLPPHSVTQISIEFERAFLKWMEYPPDANHGFYVGSSVISTVLDNDKNFTSFPLNSGTLQARVFDEDENYFLRIYTEILLVSLPTPDFSMPYNVICLACTVVALAFGPIHNITTKRLTPVEESTENFTIKMKRKISAIVTSIQSRICRTQNKSTLHSEKSEESKKKD